MKKNLKNGEGRSTILAAAAMLLVFFVAVLFASCDKGDMVATTKGSNPVIVHHDTVINGITIISELQELNGETWGVITGTNSNGETQERRYPLGGIHKFVDPNDTLNGKVPVEHLNYSVDVTVDSSTVQDVYFIEKTTKTATDQYSYQDGEYTLHPGIWYLNGAAEIFGIVVAFPRRDAEITWQSVNTTELPGDGTYDYTLVTSQYGIEYLDAVSQFYGYKTLRRQAGTNQLISITKVGEGFEILTTNQYGPTSGRSWIDLKYTYESGDMIQTVEQVLYCGVDVPADSTLTAPNFDYSWKQMVVGSDVNNGSNTNPNGTTVTDYSKFCNVGMTALFNRVFRLHWQTSIWSNGTYTFDMPSPSYQGITETHTLSDMSPVTGYNRKKAINTLHATYYGANVVAPANTIIMVAASDPDPDPTDELISRTVINSGLTYVNPTTNTSWVTIREVWSLSGIHDYNKEINVSNSVSCPTLVGIYANCANVMVTGPGTVGAEVLDHHYVNGEFTMYVYKKTFTVNCGMFEMVFEGSYEKPLLNSMNYEMPYSTYTYAVSSGSFNPLGQVVENNTTYDQMLWTQYITATLNNHTQQHSGTAEVLCLQTIDRITPDWYGDVIGAYYSRVQKFVGSSFTDNVNFVYTNVIVIMIGGNMNNQVVYARNQATANAHNLPMAPSPNLYISALWNGTAWEPCKINYTGGTENPSTNPTSWTYVNALRDHTVMRGDALGLGIGHVCHPKPTQVFTMSGPVGTLEYPVNNASSSMTGNITYW